MAEHRLLCVRGPRLDESVSGTHRHTPRGAPVTCIHPCVGRSDTAQETLAHADLIICL